MRASKRLTDKDRGLISAEVGEFLDRIPLSSKFPIPLTDDNLMGLYLSGVSSRVLAALDTLRVEKSEGTIAKTHRIEMSIQPPQGMHDAVMYRLILWSPSSKRVPVASSVITHEHRLHQKLYSWCQTTKEYRQQTQRMKDFFNECLTKCSSLGQLYRLFPFLQTHLPENYRRPYAERKSRLPSGIDAAALETFRVQLHDSLAWASLLPSSHELMKETGVQRVMITPINPPISR